MRVVTKKAALESSLQKILVADSSKFGQVRPGYFAELEEIDEIVTDDGLSRNGRSSLLRKILPSIWCRTASSLSRDRIYIR